MLLFINVCSRSSQAGLLPFLFANEPPACSGVLATGQVCGVALGALPIPPHCIVTQLLGK